DPANHRLAAITTQIPIGPLDTGDTRRLAESLVPTDTVLSSLAIKRVEEQSAGEPFLIHEIMKWVNLRGSDAVLAEPFTLADIVRARIADLSHDDVQLLEFVAVAGQP